MRPGDPRRSRHPAGGGSGDPEFFRRPPPPGRSRESTIRLDAEGRFFHEGERVEHPGLEAAMHTWIPRHPDDGRYILTNGYDWSYFTVEGTPFFVRGVRVEPDGVVLRLSDGTEEPWEPRETRVLGDRITTRVKRGSPAGPFDARFDRHAQIALGEALEERDGALFARIGKALVPLG